MTRHLCMEICVLKLLRQTAGSPSLERDSAGLVLQHTTRTLGHQLMLM
jgi:hypothetical protein